MGRGIFRKPYVDSAGVERILEVPDALYCPSMTRTLIGVRCLRDLGHKVLFDSDAADPTSEGSIVIRAPDRSTIASFTLHWDGTHYVMPAARTSALSATKAGGNFSTHEIMGHANHRAVNDAIRAGRIIGAPGPSVEHGTCTVCAAAKLHQAARRTSTEYAPTCIGEFVHVDCMTSNIVSSSGYKYILGFVDAKSGATVSIKMKKRSDAGKALELFMQTVAASGWFSSPGFSHCTFFSDNEFVDGSFQAMAQKLNQKCIETHGTDGPSVGFKYCSPHSSFSNGKVERSFRTISNMTRCMLFSAGVSAKYWDLAYAHATYVHNCIPTAATGGISPYEQVHGKPPDVSKLLPFGAIVAKWKYAEQRKKWDPKASFVVFVGVDPLHPSASIQVLDLHTKQITNTRSYRPIVADPHDTRTLMERWKAASVECPLPAHIDLDQEGTPFLPDDVDTDTPFGVRQQLNSAEQECPLWFRTPKDNMTPRVLARTFGVAADTYVAYLNTFEWPGVRAGGINARTRFRLGTDVPRPSAADLQSAGTAAAHAAMSASLNNDEDNPSHSSTIKASNPHKAKWADARLEHWKGHVTSGTFVIMKCRDVPKGRRIDRGKWVHKRKRCPDTGAITRYKSRYCARGFLQRPGEDFNPLAVSSSVLGIASLRFLIAQACRLDFELTGCDIADAYVQSSLDRPLYLDLPPDVPGLKYYDQDGDKLCALCVRSLFGFRQSGRMWSDKLRETLAKLGCKPLKSDPNVHIFTGADGRSMWIGVYSDDLIIASPCRAMRDRFVKQLHAVHPLRDDGVLTSMLGMKIDQVKEQGGARTVRISMPSYIEQMAARFGLSQCKKTLRPVGTDAKDLSSDEDPAPTAIAADYRQRVGACLWASITTRPECAATVATCCKFMAAPTKRSCALIDRVIRYLTSSSRHGIVYRCDNPGMHNIGDSGVSAFSDANWAGCADSARSTSGVCLMCANGVFEYYSRMQRSVSLSSTESECIALASCTVEVEFFKSMAAELGFTDTTTPWPTHVDNKSSIFAAHNDGVRRTRHINVKFAKVREAVSENMITIKHVPGGNSANSEQVADIFTKNCNGPIWDKFAHIISGSPVVFHDRDVEPRTVSFQLPTENGVT